MALPSEKADSNAPKARELTSRVLEFLSTANNETIGACVVGLGAVTYLVLGRVGLVLIGAVGGVVLHATWDKDTGDVQVETKRRKEVGLDIVKRLLEVRDASRNGNHQGDEDVRGELDAMLLSRKELNFDDFKPETGAALTSLVDAVIRDYVKYWYSPVLPSEVSFPFACRQTLTTFILGFSTHLSRKRPADTFLNFLTNSTSIFIVFLTELSHALMAPGMYDRDVGDAIQIYLEEKPDSNLASVLNKDQHEKKFKMVAEDILQTYLDTKAYNCEPVKVFLREILAGVILESVLKSCSRPEWINEWIIYLLEGGEPEIMNAIDAGVGGATGKEVVGSTSSIDRSSTLVEPRSPNGLNSAAAIDHQRKVSKAETAMDEAMQEAKRLSELIAQEEAKKAAKSVDLAASVIFTEASTDQPMTPSSSQSDPQTPAKEHETVAPSEADVPAGMEQSSASAKGFTSFDQILPPQQQSPNLADTASEPEPLTLHRANVNIFDDAQPGEKSMIKTKPTVEYLLQIEPRTSRYPGWMTARKYTDFETLHEVLRRIAPISGVPQFTQKYAALPDWRKKTKTALSTDLETYLKDALSYEPLAESEGMKRFLEKEQQLGRPTPTKGVLGFPTPEAFQTMGKGMLDVLAVAPKGVAGGGKAIVGGVTGIFGGQKKSTSGSKTPQMSRVDTNGSQSRQSIDPSRLSMSSTQPRPSQDSLGPSASPSLESPRPPLPPNKPTPDNEEQPQGLGILSEARGGGLSSENSSTVAISRPDSEGSLPNLLSASDLGIQLPPPPSEMTDDFTSVPISSERSTDTALLSEPRALDSEPSQIQPSSNQSNANAEADTSTSTSHLQAKPQQVSSRSPMDEQETQVAIELIFAVINELYTLSSAWNIRRTLLNAAKTYLLRPGNPQLEAIRVLLQDSVIEANTSDTGIASHILKLRENSLPTEEELKTWPSPPDEDEKERLRIKARKLLVEKGMPQALTSVMGQAASGEALGRVFDSLQVEDVSRGLMFALLLQGVRAVTH